MQEEAIYRCVNPACARLMPRPVKFCPWCGTAQAGAQAPGPAAMPSAGAAAAPGARTAADLDAESRRAAGMAAAANAASAPSAASGAAGLSGWSDAPSPPSPAAAPAKAAADVAADADAAGAQAEREAAATAAARAGLAGAGARAGVRADVRPRAGLFGTAFGHGARAQAEPAPDSVPRPAIPPRPARRQRAPIRLRWWLLVLAILWGVWLLARPNAGRKIEQRIDHAIALAGQCKANEAQDELIALRKSRATPDQLERLQAALNEGAAACTRKRLKDKAWVDTNAAVEAALAAGNPERASARLQGFTRRYGDDDRTRALRQRIEDARHPLAAPSA